MKICIDGQRIQLKMRLRSNTTKMKKSISIFLLLFFTAGIHAQYHPLINESNTWKGIMYGFFVQDFYEVISGDSIVGSQTYKKVWYGSAQGQYDFIAGLIREDSTNKKVYILQGTTEHQLYDFNAETGNDISTYGITGVQIITVTNTGSVMVNGTSRKIIYFEDFGGPAFWVEGIGSVFGIVDGALGPIADYGPWVTCFYMGNDLRWENPTNDNPCSLTLSVFEMESVTLNIYPNPASDRISIQHNSIESSGIYSLQIYSSTGQLIEQRQLTKQGLQSVDISSFEVGLYFVLLRNRGQTNGIGIVCKEQ